MKISRPYSFWHNGTVTTHDKACDCFYCSSYDEFIAKNRGRLTMDDKILGHLREARAAIIKKQESAASRELAIVKTKCEEAILWRQYDLQLKAPSVDEASK